MSAIWLILMLTSLGALIVTKPDLALVAMVDGASGAVSLGMKLVANYALWMGFFSLLESLGISAWLARVMRPVVNFLFPHSNEKAKSYVSMNISANLLGLGNAATPMGINAMYELAEGKEEVNDNMIMLLVISATSLQILPTTVISMRAAAGSVAPTSILFPSIVATVLSTVLGVMTCKLISGVKKRRNKQPVLQNTSKICKKKRRGV